MRTKVMLLFSMIILSTNTFSQTYELVSVFEDKSNETYLSYWDEIENPTDTTSHIFSLWGYQRYAESWIIAYEVEYLKRDAVGMLLFLETIVDFSEKYKNRNNVITHISGTKVKSVKQGAVRYTTVYDCENKVCCFFTSKQWANIRDKFIAFCLQNNIDII